MVFSLKKQTQQPATEKQGLLKRLALGLQKTRARFAEGVVNLFTGKKVIDTELIEELETYLLSADIGVKASQELMAELTKQIHRKHINDPALLLDTLKSIMLTMLKPAEQPILIQSSHQPFVIMMVGVNGAGKTTTTGKITQYYQQNGYQVMLAAADTFRAAAIEQLQTWGKRNRVPVIAQHTGADSAAVSFDALESAKSKQLDLLIIDTAGRLHTQSHLMDELKKIKRVISKLDTSAPHEVLLVLDATIGQNALQQAKLFKEAIGVTGLCITKLDGTAKGGIVFAIAKEFNLPIRFIGVGEQVTDLQPFIAEDFIQALFATS
ncbi:MAG: signal recognition particle-docking protein FtsY [Gammaproteobacteria bacterium RIFCSPHIGHO2_12_FULL_35_23]|nr:MAG: signal recognition particle-docking protein FtsY [Gammaproteobacteria bacterium RIFCSPHIGHO2_12_FULL_35_23]